jgi:hypothetical protein
MTDAVVIPFVPKFDAAAAERKIHELSINSNNVILTKHAIERMEERDFSMDDLFDVLRSGYVDEAPEFDNDKKNWVCKIVKRINSVRDAGVVTAIVDRNQNLLIITMEWEFFK